MAIIQGTDITTESITTTFKTTVIDEILKDCYHAGNIPMCKGYQCVPTNMMDHLNNVDTNTNVGEKADIVNATIVLNGLIAMIRNLTRVGTFSFTVNMRHSESGANYLDDPAVKAAMKKASDDAAAVVKYTTNNNRLNQTEYQRLLAAARDSQAAAEKAIQKWKDDHQNVEDSGGKSWTTEIGALSGKVIFNKSYIRQSIGAPADTANTEYGNIIKAADLNKLMANIYQHWYNYDREKYTGQAIVCHTSCHFNCHSNCHFNCHSACHGWTLIKANGFNELDLDDNCEESCMCEE